MAWIIGERKVTHSAIDFPRSFGEEGTFLMSTYLLNNNGSVAPSNMKILHHSACIQPVAEDETIFGLGGVGGGGREKKAEWNNVAIQ
jgi:hypothetical protein